MARQGQAGLGTARQGLAGLGKARQGKARSNPAPDEALPEIQPAILSELSIDSTIPMPQLVAGDLTENFGGVAQGRRQHLPGRGNA